MVISHYVETYVSGNSFLLTTETGLHVVAAPWINVERQSYLQFRLRACKDVRIELHTDPGESYAYDAIIFIGIENIETKLILKNYDGRFIVIYLFYS